MCKILHMSRQNRSKIPVRPWISVDTNMVRWQNLLGSWVSRQTGAVETFQLTHGQFAEAAEFEGVCSLRSAGILIDSLDSPLSTRRTSNLNPDS